MATLITKTSDTSPTSEDVTYVVNDPAGTPADRKVTLGNLITKAHGLSDEMVKVASGVMTAATAGTDYYKPSGTDIPVADGGTGASDAATARTNLGLAIGTDVQAYDADLAAIAGLSGVRGDIIYRDATQWQRLPKGNNGQYLQMGADDPSWVDAGSSGQTLYDRIVATSGGDYTTLQAALDASSSGDTIFVRSGTFSLTANKTYAALNNITIIGENPATSLIDLVSYTLTMSGTNINFVNIGVTRTTGTLVLSGEESSVSGCYLQGTAATTNNFVSMTGAYSKFVNNYCEGTADVSNFIYTNGSFNFIGSNVFKSTGNSTNAAIGFIHLDSSALSNAVVGNTLTSNGTTVGTPYIYCAGNLSTITGNAIRPYSTNTYRMKGVVIAGSTAVTVTDNFIYDCYDGIYTTASNSVSIGQNWIGEVGASRYQIYVGSANSNVTGNCLQNPKTSGYGVAVVGVDKCNISSNKIVGSAYGVHVDASSQYCTVSANQIDVSADNLIGIYVGGGQTDISGNSISCVTGTGAYAIFVNAGSNYTINGNNINGLLSSAGNGIYFNSSGSTNCTVTGNSIKSMQTGITMAGTGHVVTGNVIDSINSANNSLVTGSEIITMRDNLVIDASDTHSRIIERKVLRMKNTSGGSLAAGDLVVLKSVAAGDEITTTTTGGDSKVFGMVLESIGNNAIGAVLVEGKTTQLKVNGTTDIAIGDYISTYTSAGIGQKASAGQTAIAIALEAYTADDSLGVIDALLIAPRYI